MSSFSPNTRGIVTSPRRAMSPPRSQTNSAFNFVRFGKSNFLGGVSPTYSRTQLKTPLLPIQDERDNKVFHMD